MKVLPTMGSTYSGSLRGITASHNKGGLYFRGRTTPVNPGSGQQVQVRGFFGSLSQIWTDTLTQLQRDAWDNYAQNVSWVDSLGQTIQLSGINHYVRANTPRLQASAVLGLPLARIDDAPAVNELGVSPTVTSASIGNAAGPPNVITADVAWSNFASFSASDVLLLFVSGSQNPGIKFFKGPYILSGSQSADAGGGASVVLFDDTPTATPYSDRFGAPVVGQRLHGYARVTMADGRLSSAVRFDLGLVPSAS